MKDKKIQEAEEQLKRVLLMMKYDSSKTLSENKEQILEDDYGTAAAVGVGGGAALGAGAVALGSQSVPVAVAVGSTFGPTAAAIGSTLGIGLAGGAAVLGGSVGLAVLPLAYWIIRKDTGSANSVKELLQMCSTNPNIKKLERKLSDTQIRDLSDKINDAINYSTGGFIPAGTDEESLYSAFNSVSEGTAADICALNDKYKTSYGDLYEDLDSDIDSPDEWKKIYRPLRNCVEDSLLKVKEENKCPEGQIINPKTNKCEPLKKGGNGTSKYKVCNNFPYGLYCKSEVIRKVQQCLGTKDDSLLGPATENALKANGYSLQLTKEMYDKIVAKCSGTQTSTQQTEVNPYDNWEPNEPETGDASINKQETDTTEG
jgi:uncharacterized membrane protein YhiD involved in acid resistance